jgi:hypothetical protein
MMRALIVPLVAFGAVIGTATDEPTEREMRGAFEGALALQVRNALDFADETAGPDAVAKIRASGMDHYAVQSFRKLNCVRDGDKPGYRCMFAVDIGLAGGALQRTITGRFMSGPGGVVFADEG